MNDKKNYFRVKLMMFLPWLKEEEIENCDSFKKYEENEQIIAENRHRFESVIATDFERAQEEVREEIRKVYEENEDINDNADRMNDVDEHLRKLSSDEEEDDPDEDDETKERRKAKKKVS